MLAMSVQRVVSDRHSLLLPGMVFVGVFVAATAVLMTPPVAAVSPAPGFGRAAAPPSQPKPPLVEARIAPPPEARDAHFRGCRDAHAAGRYSIPAWDPSYREGMDGDHDGFACEPLPRSDRPSAPRPGRVRVLR